MNQRHPAVLTFSVLHRWWSTAPTYHTLYSIIFPVFYYYVYYCYYYYYYYYYYLFGFFISIRSASLLLLLLLLRASPLPIPPARELPPFIKP